MVPLDILSALAAVAAAILWLKSAKIKTPDNFSIFVARANGSMGQPLGDPLGATYVGHAFSQDLQNLAHALIKQSKLSARAALCAGASAILQAISLAAHNFLK